MNRYSPSSNEFFPASPLERSEQPFFNRPFVRPFRQEEDVLMRWLPVVQKEKERPAILLLVQGMNVEIIRDFALFLHNKYPVKVETQKAPALENLLAGFIQAPEQAAALSPQKTASTNGAAQQSEPARKEAPKPPDKALADVPSQKDLQLIQKIIRANLDNEKFKVGDLARSMNCCEMQLSRKMRQFTELSPSNYIRACRLEAAKILLQKPELNVSEVAFKAGFNSPEYFTRCFKEYYGICPSDFKNRKSKK